MTTHTLIAFTNHPATDHDLPQSATRNWFHDTVISQYDYALADSKGRRIGAQVKTWQGVVLDWEAGRSYCVNAAAGDTIYCYEPGATRDGQHFGASKASQIYYSAEARDAAVQKYLRGAARRYARKADTVEVAPLPAVDPVAQADDTANMDDASLRQGRADDLDALVSDMHAEVEAQAAAGNVPAVAWKPADAALVNWQPPADWATCAADPVAVRTDDAARGQAVRVLIYRALHTAKEERLTNLPTDTLQTLWAAIYGRTTGRTVVSNLVRWCRGAISNPDHVAEIGKAATVRKPSKVKALQADLEALRAAVYRLTLPDNYQIGGGRVSVPVGLMTEAAKLLPADYTPAAS